MRYNQGMNASRAVLHELVDELPEQQLTEIIAEMQERIRPPRLVGAKPFAWMGAGPANNGRTDNALRIKELLAEGFGR
jgi:hypothetical protein